MWIYFVVSTLITTSAIAALMYLLSQKQTIQLSLIAERLQQQQSDKDSIMRMLQEQQQQATKQRESFDQHQIKSLSVIQDSLHKAANELRQQITTTLQQNTQSMNQRVDQLTKQTEQQLKHISTEVDKKLSQGFEKTTATFNDILKRLTIIDSAQQKITELSTNVVTLQEILADKQSRGAFGEVQMSALIRNMIPENHFSLQHTLSNGKRCDCILFLPEPTGNMVVDAKFPLETYQAIQKCNDSNLTSLQQAFRRDIKKHINDISNKYIIDGETADGAMMFIPAEAIFAEIHANHPDLVEYAHQQRVWMVSPTTMMAVLTTARAVLKDAATRKQVHIIQEHLIALGKDFGRFQTRMDNLARHINQANEDVEKVYTSSKKISSRFSKIEQVDLTTEESDTALLETD